MIRVSVHLISAVSRDRDRELARMDIANDGRLSRENPHLGAYVGVTYRGRTKAALDQGLTIRRAEVTNWPRERLHVWNLVHWMLQHMGYSMTAPKVGGADSGEACEPVLVGYAKHKGLAPSGELAVVGYAPGQDMGYAFSPSLPQGAQDWEPVYAFRPVPVETGV